MASAKQTSAAGQYAQAILDLANEQQQAEAVGDELTALSRIIRDNPTLAALLRDPAIGDQERWQTLEKVFKGRISPLLLNTMGVLNERDRLALLPAIAAEYSDLLDRQMGRIEVDLTVAHRLDETELRQVRERISRALKKDAVVRQRVDEAIIGGLMLRVEDKLIDASVKSQLEAMRRQLMLAAPK
jgi:F-type H+-transporting ATPase subunit delta